MSETSDYFARMTPEERERLDEAARRCPLNLPRMPIDRLVMEEVLAWQALEIDVLEMYTTWLELMSSRFESAGIDWTVDNLNRYSRLWGTE